MYFSFAESFHDEEMQPLATNNPDGSGEYQGHAATIPSLYNWKGGY